MIKNKIIDSLSGPIPHNLSTDLVDSYLIIRQDAVTNTLGRTAPGKFVETFVQILQFLDTGHFDSNPSVDAYLKNLDSKSANLDEGLRICAARIGRAMYTLRNKRNIAHKGQIDPNKYDLLFLLSAAQWTLSELIRSVRAISMDDAGKIVEQLHLPVDSLVEDFKGRRVVIKNLPVREELLLLLHSYYPEFTDREQIVSAMDRRSAKTVRSMVRDLWKGRLLEGNDETGYKLTQRGFQEATIATRKCMDIV